MCTNLGDVITDVDNNINAGVSFLVEDPESFLQYGIDIEPSLKIIV